MSGGGQTQTKSENKDPWAPTQPYLTDIMQSGQDLYRSNVGSQTYGGPLQAGQSAATGMGINALTNTANSQAATAGQPLAYGQSVIQNNGLTPAYNAPTANYTDVANNASLPTAASRYLLPMASGADAGKDPYLTQMLDDNAARIGNRINSAASGAGRYGSFGHGDALARSITAANAPILSDAYKFDKTNMINASGAIDASNRAADATKLGAAQGQTGIANAGASNAATWGGMIPSLQQSAYMPGNTLMGIGDYQNQYAQRNIDLQRQLFEQQQAMPWTQLARYSGAVSGLSPLMANAGTTTGTQETQKNLGLQDYTQMFSQLFGGGNSSAAAGGATAAKALMFSDRTAKTDIEKLGDDPRTGLPMYAYRYKSDVREHGRGIPKVVGPMAQDIEEMLPGSTVRIGGKLAVKREALGILGL